MTLTVARKISALIAIALVGIAVVAALMWKQVGEVFDAANFANLNTVPSVREIDTAADAVSDLRAELWQAASLSGPKQAILTALEQKIAEHQRTATEALDKYEKEDMDEPTALFVPDKAGLEATRSVLASYLSIKDQALALIGTGNADQARELLTENMPLSRKITPTLMSHRRLNMEFAAKAAVDALATRSWALTLCAGAAGVVFATLVGLGYVIGRSILVPLNQAVQAAKTAATGDLTTVIDVRGADETSHLLLALKDMNHSLGDVVQRIRDSSASIATGSAQIAAGNTDLSRRTEAQAASLEQTAASMQQLTATVKQNAENARQGNALASSASEIAASGGDLVKQVVGTMQKISSSSAKVADIIAVIEGIAFQTNILALNAAVEAARAGAEGKGFAVVASEVRALAHRSADAAKQIRALISESVNHVDAGTALVSEAGHTMIEIVRSVGRVTELMSDITSASAEQHTGIEQVNQAVTQMDEVTQQNAALVEEAAAAAQSMAAQSRSMQELMSIFRVHVHAT